MLIEDNNPESLVTHCCKYCVQNPKTFCEIGSNGKILKLKDGVSLPQTIAETLVNSYQKHTGEPVDDDFINILSYTANSRVEQVHIPNAQISDSGLEILFRHKIVCLDITGVSLLSPRISQIISERGTFLRQLNCSKQSTNFVEHIGNNSLSVFSQRGYVFLAPNLKWFKVTEFDTNELSIEYMNFDLLLNPLTSLAHLDLSDCSGVREMDFLKSMHSLSSLVLFNVEIISGLTNICNVKTIKHLDISQDGEKYFEYTRPQEVLHLICVSLPMLCSLDISGTNLTDGSFDEQFSEKVRLSSVEDAAMTDIPGLVSRVRNPLKFLGLYETKPDLCTRRFPAINVCGKGSEVQVLTALRMYSDRVNMTKQVLNEVFQIFRHQDFEDHSTALDLIIEVMDKYVYERHVQVSGSASLFYIIKNLDLQEVGSKFKRKVISTLLKAVSEHRNSSTMLRNGCLLFCRFETPKDFLFDYKLVCAILLHIIQNHRQDEFVIRMAMFLLNGLVCDVGCEWKQIGGDLGTIEVMLSLIKSRLNDGFCDLSMELAWSVMWNVTDEMPRTCLAFVECGGLEVFLQCLQTFPGKMELLRNMLGLLGNISEVPHLRAYMTVKEYLTVFVKLLNLEEDGIEVRYNAGGILSHILADGMDIWAACEVDFETRDEVLQALTSAVVKWDINSPRSINYRSFRPIFRLVKSALCPEAQHWGVWALANLTTVSSQKYFKFIEDNNGIEILHKILENPVSFQTTKDFAKIVIENYRKFKHSETPN